MAMTSPERESLNEALGRVTQHASQWLPFAYLAVREAATSLDRLTSDDVWRILQARRIPPPHEPRAMAPAMIHGARQGWIIATPEYRTQEHPATGRHPGPQRVYRSTVTGMEGPTWPVLREPNVRPAEPPPVAPAPPECPVVDCALPLDQTEATTLGAGWVVGRCAKHGRQMTRWPT